VSSLVRGSRTWLVGLAVSLSIFAALALGACGSSSNDSVNKALDQANQAEQQGLDQAQQGLDQAKKQLKQSGVNDAQAQDALDNAQKFARCVSDAGTDTGKLQDCQSQFGS
jgi:outer membrane protein TolC